VLDEPERLQHALGLAYRYLNRRERTVTEVRRYLERNGVDAASRESALGVLIEEGTIDDARFARLFVEDKRELEEWGSDRIRQALLVRCVDPDLVEAALTEPDGGSEVERALALLCRRFPAPAGDRRERERALGMLLRKGYDVELALDALAAHTRERDEL
jgi:regulatory protein